MSFFVAWDLEALEKIPAAFLAVQELQLGIFILSFLILPALYVQI